MARRKSSRKQFILTLKKELMGRDPLGQELTEVLVELGVYCLPDDDAREALYARRAALIAALIEKYDVDAIEVEDSWDAYCRRLQKALEADGLSQAPIIDWWPVGAEQPYSIATNLRVTFDPTGLVPVTFIPASPPDGEAPQLQVTVNLAQINWWDLDRLATDVKRAAQDALTAWSRVQEASPHPFAVPVARLS